jgi:hypothetical protein
VRGGNDGARNGKKSDVAGSLMSVSRGKRFGKCKSGSFYSIEKVEKRLTVTIEWQSSMSVFSIKKCGQAGHRL